MLTVDNSSKNMRIGILAIQDVEDRPSFSSPKIWYEIDRGYHKLLNQLPSILLHNSNTATVTTDSSPTLHNSNTTTVIKDSSPTTLQNSKKIQHTIVGKDSSTTRFTRSIIIAWGTTIEEVSLYTK